MLTIGLVLGFVAIALIVIALSPEVTVSRPSLNLRGLGVAETEPVAVKKPVKKKFNLFAVFNIPALVLKPLVVGDLRKRLTDALPLRLD